MSHPSTRLDPVIHQPTRLGILTAAAESKRIDFSSLRELLDLTDGNLSRHLATLEGAGYVKIEKIFEKRKPRTWVSITRAGRSALKHEIDALREIVSGETQGASRPSATPRTVTP